MVYGGLPHAGVLPPGYETTALPIVDQQLEKAAVRLAEVLNAALPRRASVGPIIDETSGAARVYRSGSVINTSSERAAAFS